jgi:hypothetical protein
MKNLLPLLFIAVFIVALLLSHNKDSKTYKKDTTKQEIKSQ